MKYVITGSLGHISKPVVSKLVAAGHAVTVITSSPDRAKDITALGATAAVGSVDDLAFLKQAFAGADAAYLMIPPNWTPEGGWLQYQQNVTHHFIEAIQAAQVKNIVLLSSVGAHMRTGAGPVDGLSYCEEKLASLKGVNVKVLRPSYFYYNLLGMVPLVRNMNIMGSNFGSTDEKLVLTHTDDIADVVADALLKLNFTNYSVQYIASDERHPNEIARVLGAAVGKPGTPWVEFKDADALSGMLQSGLHPAIANGYVELGAGIRSGAVQADYWKNRPALGKKKLEDFATEFAAVYQNQ